MSMGHWRADSDGPPCLAHRTVRLFIGLPYSLSTFTYLVSTSCYSLLGLISGLTSIPIVLLSQKIPAFNYPQYLSTSNQLRSQFIFACFVIDISLG
jgi:hypothetical protein